MKMVLLFISICFSSISFSQTLSEDQIKNLAYEINYKMKGVDIGNGIILRECIAFGRTLIYQYNVSSDWYPSQNMKADLIANFKEGGISDLFFNNNINVDYLYFNDNQLLKRIIIKSKEFSPLNFCLGDYVSIKGHPNAKGVNLKLKKPNGWELKESNRPNIVKTFNYKTNTYSLLIKENMMFISRSEAKELFGDDKYVNELILETSSSLGNMEILNFKIVSLDTYPALEYVVKGNKEQAGHNLKMIMKFWLIFYEDKIISLLGVSIDEQDFNSLEGLFDLIANSVIFPEQYE